MVKFNTDTNGKECFTITCNGGKYDYIETVKSLLGLIKSTQEDLLIQNDIYNVVELIQDMLPDQRQIVSLEDAEYLESIKKKNKEDISTLSEF